MSLPKPNRLLLKRLSDEARREVREFLGGYRERCPHCDARLEPGRPCGYCLRRTRD